MPRRGAGVDALASRRAATQSSQVGFRTRFVEEDQPGRVEAKLLPTPRPPGTRDIWASLFAGVQRLFLYVSSSFCRA